MLLRGVQSLTPQGRLRPCEGCPRQAGVYDFLQSPSWDPHASADADESGCLPLNKQHVGCNSRHLRAGVVPPGLSCVGAYERTGSSVGRMQSQSDADQ